MTRSSSGRPPSGGEEPFADSRVIAAAGGDRAAAGALLTELLPRVRNLVRYLVRGDGEVDDIAQQALIAVLRGLPSFRGEGSFKSWADRITARETFRYLRRVRAARHPIDDGQDLRTLEDSSTPPDEYTIRRETVRLLDALPDEQRRAVALHYIAGMSVPEVAKETGVSFDTAKSRVRLGMKKLRARVEVDDD